MNTYEELYTKRNQCNLFSKKKVDNNVIDKIINDFYNNVPSKQSKYPYFVDILDWSNPDIRLEIFKNCHRDLTHSIDQDLGNPSVLAPILIAFTPRNVDPQENFILKNKQAAIEIGIASMFLTFAFENNNYQTGFCGCLSNPDKISRLLNHTEPTYLLLGVGKKSYAVNYLDPRTNTIKKVPNNNYHTNRKPNKNNFITFYTNLINE